MLSTSIFAASHLLAMHLLSFPLLVSVLNILQIASSGAAPSSLLVHQFPSPSWVENIRVRQNGQLLVTMVLSPDVYLIDPVVSSSNPALNATAKLLHSFPSEAGLLGITEVQPDQFYVVVGNFSLTDLTAGIGTFSVWSLDLQKYDSILNTGAAVKEIAPFTKAGILNGMDTLDSSKNLVVVADSLFGEVWLLDGKTGNTSILLKEPEFAPLANSSTIGVNGLKVLQKGDTAYIYFSTQGTALFGRILVSLSTLQKTGPVEILQNGTVVDDFVLDEEKGVAYLAATELNALLSIPLTGGEVTTISGGVNETLLATPTSAVFGRGALEKDLVYVTTESLTVGGKVVAVDIASCS